MQTKYLHISAYACDRCDGPVISGAFGTRETEISRESALTQVGAVCLTCGNKQTEIEGHMLLVTSPLWSGACVRIYWEKRFGGRPSSQSCRTMLSSELCTCIPLMSYSTKPSLRNRFIKKLTRERVVPTISASDSWLIFGMTVSGLPSFPK